MTAPTRVLDGRDPRAWPSALAGMWRRSLRFRITLLTVALSALAVVISSVVMALAIQNHLYDSRRDEVMSDAHRAVVTAQTTLNSSEAGRDRARLQQLMNSVVNEIRRYAGSESWAVIRIDSEPSLFAPQGSSTGQFDDLNAVSSELARMVEDRADSQWVQPVELPAVDGSVSPGLVVGQQITFPEAGGYAVYFAYDLGPVEQTLRFVQAVLWVAALALLFLIGAISWFVLRAVTFPIAQTAETSARLAAGDLGVRVEVYGNDELAVLGRSFNGMADSIERQIKELAELSLVQQRFVSDVSHELRTPLTTIRLAADMINDHRDEFDPVTKRAAELLWAQVQRFELLLGDLLEISRYDAGSVELENEPTSLAHLAEDVIASMQQLVEQHGSDVRLVAPGGYSPVDMDPRRIRRIVRNLLGNAIEHGEGRPIVVTVDSNQHAVAIGVRDFGLGMSAAATERVFDRFWRADPSRKRTIGGTGLGLSIALGDATLHGGTLTVWSEAGRGSQFVLTLPRGGELTGESPIPALPNDDGTAPLDELGMTQPINLSEGANT